MGWNDTLRFPLNHRSEFENNAGGLTLLASEPRYLQLHDVDLLTLIIRL